MISDVLSDAIDQIKDYERKFPTVYGGTLKPYIAEVLQKMNALRELLDTPPQRVN